MKKKSPLITSKQRPVPLRGGLRALGRGVGLCNSVGGGRRREKGEKKYINMQRDPMVGTMYHSESRRGSRNIGIMLKEEFFFSDFLFLFLELNEKTKNTKSKFLPK